MLLGFSDVKTIYAFAKFSSILDMLKAENNDCFIMIKIQTVYEINIYRLYLIVLKFLTE